MSTHLAHLATVQCGVPHPPNHGSIVNFTTTQVVYRCDPGFESPTQMVAMCDSGSWSPAPPMCTETTGEEIDLKYAPSTKKYACGYSG